MDQPITLDANTPVPVTLAPPAWQVVLDGLNELPFKRSSPVIAAVVEQLQKHQAKPEKGGKDLKVVK